MRRVPVIGSSSPSPKRPTVEGSLPQPQKPPAVAAESSEATMPTGHRPVNHATQSARCAGPRTEPVGLWPIPAKLPSGVRVPRNYFSKTNQEYGLSAARAAGAGTEGLIRNGFLTLTATSERREKFSRFQLTSIRAGAYIPAIGVVVRSRRDDAPHQAPHWYSEKRIRQSSGARSCGRLTVRRRVGASRSRAV